MTRSVVKNSIGSTVAFAIFACGCWTLAAVAAQPLAATPSAAERVEWALALEQVRYSHQEWPEANLEPKPPLDQFFSRDDAARLVDSHLRMGSALRNLWQEEVTPQEIQAEMDRMAHGSKLPGRLQEYWAALGNDPLTIAECLVRPLLTEQKLRERYTWDKSLHAEVRLSAAAEAAQARSTGALGNLSGSRSQCRYLTLDRLKGRAPEEGEMLLGVEEWQALRQRFSGSEAGPFGSSSQIGPVLESEEAFFAQVATEVEKGSLLVTTYSWAKRPFDDWWQEAKQDQPEDVSPVAAYHLPAITYQPEDAHQNWTAINTVGAPSARRKHGVVWTGSKMVVWGGENFDSVATNTGGAYDPATDSWTATKTSGAPSARIQYRNAVWTGSRMVVWGETTDSTGGVYNPSNDSWVATSTTNPPTPRSGHCAVWNNSKVVVWGGAYTTITGDSNNGMNLDPSGSTTWSAQAATGTGPRRRFAAAYDSSLAGVGGVILWGGSSGTTPTYLNSGAFYTNPDGWFTTNLTGAPSARELATGVWNPGNYFMVWGGHSGTTPVSTGSRWVGPTSPGTWTALATTGSLPAARTYHSAVWASGQTGMVVWGGQNLAGSPTFYGDGAIYTSTWTALSATNTPSARSYHSAVYASGTYSDVMLVWGGGNATVVTNTGGAYHFCKLTSLPVVGAAITAVDQSACSATGVKITWPQDPSDWRDDNFGPRSYVVLRGGAAISTPAYPATTFTDLGGTPNTAYNYSVRYSNGCGHTVDTGAVSATDATDAAPCASVGETLMVARSSPNAALSWTAVVGCADLAGYKVYGATSYSAAFPGGWVLLSSPATNSALDALASSYIAYKVVSVDGCGNASAN